MSYRKSLTVESEGKPTIDHVIAALTELREEHGGSVRVEEVRGRSRFSRSGGVFVTAITIMFAGEPKGEARAQ